MAKPFNFVSLTKDGQFGTLLRPLCHFWEPLQNESMNDPFFRMKLVTVFYQRNASTPPGLVDKLTRQPVAWEAVQLLNITALDMLEIVLLI